MELFYISFSAGALTFLVLSIIEYIILGDRGREKQISNYFKYIKGNTSTEKKKKVQILNNNQNSKISKKKYIIYAVPVCMCIFVIIYISSKSIVLSFIISLLGGIYPKAIISNKNKKRKEILNLQLRDALNSIVMSLRAGLSINSALIKCSEDLERLYSLAKEKPMLEEFNKIKSDLNMGMSVDESLGNYMKRMQMEDVNDFVNSVIIVRQKGGNLVEVMTNVTQMITDKLAMRREIGTLIASKKLEAKIMTLVPIFIIITLSIFSSDYMKPLYESFIGQILIVMGFIFLVINYFVSNKIVDIQL
ncbi:bacterial type II secretion system protein F domain protein [Clostridium puniceum]|uniref:Bacterial type II secretion system protein F domain protein n=1 Tax=Clostridium puniceum TaxID=29367 RepID=A0A1S8TS33_9CLOT|nr:type II secretion system F family protein [Clostridium puniceum]OOM80583.1 bacterial type II secretion system protein F domain protein [Clostridium puniceum]